nr:extracellular matrix/biofilm biosynthesis regulator RemA family protein [Paenibacillus caui]
MGGEKVISSKELVAIFDISIVKSSRISKQFMTSMLNSKRMVQISEEEAKSIVVTEHTVYYSPISSATLKKRCNTLYEI